jgi:hypothetical protein
MECLTYIFFKTRFEGVPSPLKCAFTFFININRNDILKLLQRYDIDILDQKTHVHGLT